MSTNNHTILVIAGNIADARFFKRVKLLMRCGYNVVWAAYDRHYKTGQENIVSLELPSAILGVARDGGHWQRLWAMRHARHTLSEQLPRWGHVAAVYCLSLDNLILAHSVTRSLHYQTPLICEIADLFPGIGVSSLKGRVLKWLERHYLRKAALLVTTSPGYVREYFTPVQRYRGRVLLIENKIAGLPPGDPPGSARPPDERSEKIRIGLFGLIRCPRSLTALRMLVKEMPNKVEVVLRGKITDRCKNLVEEICVPGSGITYAGTYRNPDDLRSVYSAVDICWGAHFIWLEHNSKLCLSNRIYEAGYFGVPQIAIANTEIGRYVKEFGLGWALDEPFEEELLAFMRQTDKRQLQQFRERLQQRDRSCFLIESDLPRIRQELDMVLCRVPSVPTD
jgi:succinoglycan biosynthesis protein ExoL